MDCSEDDDDGNDDNGDDDDDRYGHKIVVERTGTGTGAVTGRVGTIYAQINCDGSETSKCTATRTTSTNTSVTWDLDATSDSGSDFAGWSQDGSHCGTSTSCSVEVGADTISTVEAEFALAPEPEPEPEPEPDPDPGDSFSVRLTASPSTGEVGDTFKFTSSVLNVPDALGWSYLVEYSDPSCGSGASPSNFDDSTGSFTCTYSTTGVKTGSITATASPPPGAAGSDVSDSDTAQVTVGESEPPPPPPPSILYIRSNVDGASATGVEVTRWNRSWGFSETCSSGLGSWQITYGCGDLVVNWSESGSYTTTHRIQSSSSSVRRYLEAKDTHNGASFEGWSGCRDEFTIDSGAQICEAYARQTTSTVTAQYESTEDTVELMVNKGGNGTGAVTGNGISCGSTCAAEYDEGTSVSLTATPDADSEFSNWTGACTGSSATCNVLMDGNKTVTAVFDIPQPEITDFWAEPQWVRRGNDATLHWQIEHSTSCTIEDDTGGEVTITDPDDEGSYTGNITSGLTVITGYTLTCENEDGDTIEDNTTVYILPVYEEF